MNTFPKWKLPANYSQHEWINNYIYHTVGMKIRIIRKLQRHMRMPQREAKQTCIMHHPSNCEKFTMTSSNRNVFGVTAPLWGESTGGGFPSQRPMTRRFDFYFKLRLNKRLNNNRDAGDVGLHRVHCALARRWGKVKTSEISADSLWIRTN